MEPLRIRIETCVNSISLLIHFDRPISHTKACLLRFPLGPEDEKALSAIGEPGATLIKKLDAITALKEASGQRLQLLLSIGEMFSWADVLPAVFTAIREAFNIGELIVEYRRPLHVHFTPPVTPDLPQL